MDYPARKRASRETMEEGCGSRVRTHGQGAASASRAVTRSRGLIPVGRTSFGVLLVVERSGERSCRSRNTRLLVPVVWYFPDKEV